MAVLEPQRIIKKTERLINPYQGEIPSFKLFESDKTLAFLDIQPLSKGHAVCSPFSRAFELLALLLTNDVPVP